MPRNGSGTYTKAGSSFVNGATADATDVNAQIDDIVTAMTGSVAADGQTAMSGNLAMGTHKLTGLAAGTTAGDSVRYEQVINADPLAVTSLTINSIKQHEYDWWIIALSDESTNLTTGTSKATFHAPYAATVANVYAGVGVAQAAGSILAFDINEEGVSILSTTITIDNSEKHSNTAVTPPVISDSSIAAFALLSFDIDTVGTALAKGAKIYMKVSKT